MPGNERSAASESTPLFEVDNLWTSFAVGGRSVTALRGVSFTIGREEVLGLIGESGSGKTVTGLSLLRLLPDHAEIRADRIRFDGKDLSALDDDAFRVLRGTELAMIFQDPVGSFNPAKTVGWHLRQAIERRSGRGAGKGTGAGWEAEAETLLADVGIRAPRRVIAAYPHQLSGGMLQRALIAMVITLRPALIIADEPTTNLDNLVERQILDLIRLHQQRLHASVLFITHDLAIARDICDRIAVMYAGEIVEIGPAEEVLRQPRHPYSACLMETSASLERRDEFLFELPGEPSGRSAEGGCAFVSRCPSAERRCSDHHPRLVPVGPVHQAPSHQAPTHQARCLLHEK
jgi:oligopeptide/dipeptide ABC transporter ATP-binding protein